MHSDLKLVRLDERRRIHLSQLCHKNVHTKGSLSKLLHRVAEGRVDRTRRCNEYNLKVPRVKTEKGRYAFACRGPHNWNDLPVGLKAIVKHESFERVILKQEIEPFDDHPT